MAKKKVEVAVVEKVKTPRAPRKKVVKKVEAIVEEVLPVVENAVYETTKIISEHKESLEELAKEVEEKVIESVSLSTKVKSFFKNLFKKK